ncbi:MAG: NUDIX hydrolase [Parcubacteria group bacterium Gr01-1014_30]|nr:MAG: NUDIX hydrolase [Parcubacteria group bacterium Gr01-1014_30]
MVVNRELIFKDGRWQGLKTENLDYYLDLIRNNFQFRKRGEVEKDPSWQQIIPYILFNFKDEYFLYRYLKKASERRLKDDWLLGIGGHINPVDLKRDQDILDAGAWREWQEEIVYNGNLLEKKLIGILNDDRREVEAVHLGLVYLFKGDSHDIFVREKDVLKGEMVKLQDLEKRLENIGGWAQIVYREYLSKFL